MLTIVESVLDDDWLKQLKMKITDRIYTLLTS